ncbi:MAG: hypothetical protein NZM42_05175 [Gemmatales bacterium]|nr:hypothetical protein [Gemmatales bacterium]MDW8222776.1 hypothetical protein [Gemmatales bacterium]
MSTILPVRAVGLRHPLVVMLMSMAWLMVFSKSGMSQRLELAPHLRVMVYSPNLEIYSNGYWPVVCVFENSANRAMRVEIRCPSDDSSRYYFNWRAVRRLTVEPESTARVTLWLPPPVFSKPDLEFRVEGHEASKLWLPIVGPRGSHFFSRSGSPLPLVLASSEAARLARQLRFGEYFLTEQPQVMSGLGSGGYYHYPTAPTFPVPSTKAIPPSGASPPASTAITIHPALATSPREFQLTVWEVPVTVWDTHWISYTPFLGVILTPKDWEEAPAAVREAWLRWVACGGQLLLLDLYPSKLKPIPSRPPFESLVPEFVPMDDTGQYPAPETNAPKTNYVAELPPDPAMLERRRRVVSSLPTTDSFALVLREIPKLLEGLEPRPVPCGFGDVYYVLGSYAELHVPPDVKLVSSAAQELLEKWAQGVEARHRLLTTELPSANYLLAEALQVAKGMGVPVLGFFLLLVAFSVLIGPVAILTLNRYRRLIWLMWIIPLVAATTCLLILAYGFFGEGLSARVAIRSLTLLDERHHRATTLGVLGIYSPITPPGGVQWDYDLEPTFFSQWKYIHDTYSYGYYSRGPYSGSRNRDRWAIDWTQRQHLTGGYVLPRVREFVLARRSEVRRERLVLRRAENRLWAANNFGVTLRNLVVCDHEGLWWRADQLAAGEEVELQRSEPPESYTRTLARVHRDPKSLLLPSQNPDAELNVFPGMLSQWFVNGDRANRTCWLASLCSESGPEPEALLCPGRYFAELQGSPFLDSGLRRVGIRDERCWVIGILESPPR